MQMHWVDSCIGVILARVLNLPLRLKPFFLQLNYIVENGKQKCAALY